MFWRCAGTVTHHDDQTRVPPLGQDDALLTAPGVTPGQLTSLPGSRLLCVTGALEADGMSKNITNRVSPCVD